MGRAYSRGRCQANRTNGLIREQLPMFIEKESMFLLALLLQELPALDISGDSVKSPSVQKMSGSTEHGGLVHLVHASAWRVPHFTTEKWHHLLLCGMRDKVLQTSTTFGKSMKCFQGWVSFPVVFFSGVQDSTNQNYLSKTDNYHSLGNSIKLSDL